jgi:hypothetical protein
VTEDDKVVATLLPPVEANDPDFVARAKAIWGESPAGVPFSQVVSEARRNGQ